METFTEEREAFERAMREKAKEVLSETGLVDYSNWKFDEEKYGHFRKIANELSGRPDSAPTEKYISIPKR